MTYNPYMSDDDWSENVANGEAFSAEVFVGGVPAMFPLAQFKNPLGSGVRVRLRCMDQSSFFGVFVNSNVGRHDPDLAFVGPPFAGPMNLLGSGGAAPTAEFRFDNLAVVPGSRFWLLLGTPFNRPDYPLDLDWGHDLLPGQAIINNAAAGIFISMLYQWVEIPL